MLDLALIRSQFPALDSEWALFDNAGGSVPPRQVIDRLHEYMSRWQVQLGASYELSAVAGEKVEAGRAAMARLIGASPEEVIVGPSTTQNAAMLARALRPGLRPGDEIVVTDLDHEANIGAWRRLADDGLVIREWRFDRDSLELAGEELDALLSERTRLVCFTHCSNIVGRIHDAAALVDRVHAAGALAVVDGVAYAPHRLVDVKALGADFYFLSLYKVFGPHQAVLYCKREALLAAANQNHFFFGDDALPDKLQPGNVNHELTAALAGVVDYLELVADSAGAPAGEAGARPRLAAALAAAAEHEEEVVAPLIDFLSGHPKVRLLGPATADRRVRVPTVSFVVPGRDAAEVPAALDRRKVAVRYGHFYAHRAITALGLHETNGVVRVSLAHYNGPREVERLLAGLDAIL